MWHYLKNTIVPFKEEIKNKIFDPFFTTKFTGRGPGLPIVQGIVKNHKGMIKVLSEEKKGTKISVFFPGQH
jgi:two-component system, cell cycle sensor histidine kinase and response regulator CckA